MKRSEINAVIKRMEELIRTHGIQLPPFCKWTPSDWASKGSEYDEIRDNLLGWDITDYGQGDFARIGFALITLRNGKLKSAAYPKDCEGCPHREKCHKSSQNRIVRINKELTQFHEEVLVNLNSVHGALLRMNRSIQPEGAFGGIKWNKNYKRLRRRGMEGVILELGLISSGFNLRKYHLKRQAVQKTA